ncbi:MAG TPA: biopolymer transporter ExbD [Candidatus Acidoferrales bacterium]|nr:biopolymer transporter ExbD [Candidatus Acidoferrales bacterium]
MKFPRNAKILRSHFDVAPFAAVFFLLLIFLMLGALIPTPGIPLRLPTADNLPGTDQPTLAMAVDASSNLYYDNEIVSERVLVTQMKVATNTVRAPLTLIIHADKAVSYETLVRLALLARKCGITNVLLATLPPVDPAAQP